MAIPEGELILRAKAGDRAAFAEIVRLHHATVRSLLRRLTGGEHALADDLAQEAFVRAFKGIGRFEARAKLSTWLYRIAYRVFVSNAASARVAVADDALQPYDVAAAAPAHRPLLRHDVERALLRLTRAERDAIALTFGRDMTQEDAAQILGCPLGTLKTNVTRGLAKLAQIMAPWKETA